MYRSVINNHYQKPKKTRARILPGIIVVFIIIIAGYLIYSRYIAETPTERAVNQLQFGESVSESEQQTIKQAVQDQFKTYNGTITVNVATSTEAARNSSVLAAYVPVTNIYSAKQQVALSDLSQSIIYIPAGTDDVTRSAIVELIAAPSENVVSLTGTLEELGDSDIALIPVENLSKKVKLLSLDGHYYLDSYSKGAVFRQAEYVGDEAEALFDLQLNTLVSKEEVLTVNMTGVTALTRVMMTKLNEVGDPLYFSELIGDFLADADITHVSNEVSFKEGCTINYSIFCSPPEMIEVLKASGVDLVELTGNHNNDVGSQYNTDTINLYRSLGWNVVGGGLNTEDAAKPFITDQKGSKLAFLAYNYPDSPNGNPIAGATTAGANSFDFDRIKTDIESAKQLADSVIVSVQFWECYAYPDGYVEFPECSSPIPNQKEVFRELVDLGADMVVGSSAHQPQTYEIYNGKPIYYGLGNLYFDQTQWPGTERGIVLTNYYLKGELLQTKLSPTVFDKALQTRLMTNDEAEDLLQKLNTARSVSGL